MDDNDDKELERVAAAANAITKTIGPLLRGADNFAAAVSLTGMAAHHVLHDGGSEEDFLEMCRAAWKKSAATHAADCSHN